MVGRVIRGLRLESRTDRERLGNSRECKGDRRMEMVGCIEVSSLTPVVLMGVRDGLCRHVVECGRRAGG